MFLQVNNEALRSGISCWVSFRLGVAAWCTTYVLMRNSHMLSSIDPRLVDESARFDVNPLADMSRLSKVLEPTFLLLLHPSREQAVRSTQYCT